MDFRERERRLQQLSISILISSLIVLRAAASFGQVAPSPVLVALPETYEVKGASQEILRLGDFAEIVAVEKDIRDGFRKLDIITVPKTGKQTRISRSQIVRSARMSGLPYERLRFEGPAVLEVLGAGQTITKERILQQLKDDLLNEFKWSEEELSINPVSVPESFRVPVGDVQLKLYRTSDRSYGNVRYNLTALIDEMEVFSHPLILEVAHLRPVWVVENRVEAGEPIVSGNLRREKRRMLNERADQLTVESPDEVVGLTLRRSLSRGVVLTRDMFAQELMVRRGDVVNLFIHSNSIRISVQAKAQGSGGPGDEIVVKNLANGKEVRARIISSQAVEMI